MSDSDWVRGESDRQQCSLSSDDSKASNTSTLWHVRSFGTFKTNTFVGMKTVLYACVLSFLVGSPLLGQERFRMNDASKHVDVEIQVGDCDMGNSGRCGPLEVRFFRKNSTRPFQRLNLPVTNTWDPIPKANVTNRYDDQSIINFDDFNFDGIDDVAICDGTNGGYSMPSYRIYLYSKVKKRFMFSRSFTRMNFGGLGMFETNRERKLHFVYTKSTCCWHQTQGFDVRGGRPRLVYVLTEDALYREGDDFNTILVTTEKLVKGRWRTWRKRVKIERH